MGIGLINDVRKSVTVPFKKEGELVYIIGNETSEEFGGSEYFHLKNISGGQVPVTDIDLLKRCMNGLLSVMDSELVSACHDVSEGGVAICLIEMSLGNNIGACVDVSEIPGSGREDVLLFSETATRWILSIPKGHKTEFEKILGSHDTPFSLIGETQKDQVCFKQKEKCLINEDVACLYKLWTDGVSSLMG
jgi:phosphoribosylformylglycinamidine synthase